MSLSNQFKILLMLLFSVVANAEDKVAIGNSIDSQPLADAIQEFVDKTGLQVVYESEIAENKQSLGANTTDSDEDMLDQLLADTGISYVFLNENTVALRIDDNSGGAAPEKSVPTSFETLVAQNQTSASQASQSQNSRSSDVNQQRAIEEIVVVSALGERNNQDLAISSTAFTGAQLEDNRLVQIDDIARFTPGLTGSFFNYSSPIIAIRGANNTFSQAGASKPVGVFMDDVFIPRYSASSFDLFDLQQVTVLRGPQGTLFGRNVTGGAIQVSTVPPSLDESEFKFRVGVGNHEFVELAGFASGPLSETIVAKVSVSYKDRDGFAIDRFNGQTLEDLDSVNVRAGLFIAPRDDLEIRLSADFSSDESGGRSISFLSSSDGSDLTGNDGNSRTAEVNTPQSYERDISGFSGHLDWELDGGKFQSITAYRQSDAREIYSLGSGDVALPSVSTQFLKDETDEPTSFSQEFRYVSNSSERFGFSAGIYYYSEDTDRIVGDTLLGIGGNATFVDRVFDVNAETSSIAAYANLSFHLGENLDLDIGGRYTREDKDVRVNFVDNNNGANSFLVQPSNDFSEFTPRITLTYFPTESITVFASRTEGFTAGGFNTETNSATAIQLGFDPETITSYELGAKSVWADGRFIANLTLFDQDYEDKQEGFFTVAGPFFSIFNAADASMSGAELELYWAATDALSVAATYSDLDTEYDSFVIPLGADFTGNRLSTAPEGKFSLSIDYANDIGRGRSLFAGLSYSWQDDYFSGASNIPDFFVDSYSLYNARIGMSWANDQWRVDLWSKNLGDEDYVRVRGNQGALGEFIGPPRTYGLNLTYQTQ